MGFDVILGNPPWERVKLQEKEFFAQRDPAIAGAPNKAARERLIKELPANNPALHREFREAKRQAEGESCLLRDSGLYPLCGRGDVNTYAVFAERKRRLLGPRGRVGCIVPSGIATDDTTKFFFQDLMDSKSLVSLFSFENEEFIFPAIHHATRFCLLTVGSGAYPASDAADFVFFARQTEHLREVDRHFVLSAEDIVLLNPNTRTCPIFRSKQDAELTKAIYRRVPVLIDENEGEAGNPWGISFMTMFHMANDSHLFRTCEQLEAQGWKLDGNIFSKDSAAYLPLYEGKMLHHFDHRWGTYEGQTEAQANQGKLPELTEAMHANPNLFPLPRYWVPECEMKVALGDKWNHGWLFGWRDITGATVLRTMISAVCPMCGYGHTCPLMMPQADAAEITLLAAALSSFIQDFTARQKVGGSHLTYGYLNQLPVLPPSTYSEYAPWCSAVTLADWLLPRVLELTYTAWDLEAFAKDCGYDGPPFKWDEERRFLLRCELDAAYFHLYLPADADGGWKAARVSEGAVRDETAEELAALKAYFPAPRDAVGYIMETFPIVKRKDEKAHGEYRTKRVILEIYDEMAQAARTGVPYKTRLNPPPADPSVAHPPKEDGR